MGVGDVLLFKIETEEDVFEQWSMHEQTAPKKQHQAKVRLVVVWVLWTIFSHPG